MSESSAPGEAEGAAAGGACEIARFCDWEDCRRPLHTVLLCSRCKCEAYCSKDCQVRAAWLFGSTYKGVTCRVSRSASQCVVRQGSGALVAVFLLVLCTLPSVRCACSVGSA